MSDLDRLEQLTRLRDAGALTIKEFDEQKSRLLANSAAQSKFSPKVIWVFFASILAAIVLIIYLLLFGWKNNQDVKDSSLTVAAQTATANTIKPEEPLDPKVIRTAETYGLEWASSEAVLGLNPAFIESKLGPPKVKNASSFDYDIAGCGISYGISDGRVNDVTIALSQTCSPTVAGQKLRDGMTFGNVNNYDGNLRADCMMLCGNAADPTIEYFVPGYHANQFIQYEYSAVQDKEAETWQNAIRLQHGHAADDYQGDDNEWYQCVSSPPQSVRQKARAAKIFYVRFGYEWSKNCNFS